MPLRPTDPTIIKWVQQNKKGSHNKHTSTAALTRLLQANRWKEYVNVCAIWREGERERVIQLLQTECTNASSKQVFTFRAKRLIRFEGFRFHTNCLYDKFFIVSMFWGKRNSHELSFYYHISKYNGWPLQNRKLFLTFLERFCMMQGSEGELAEVESARAWTDEAGCWWERERGEGGWEREREREGREGGRERERERARLWEWESMWGSCILLSIKAVKQLQRNITVDQNKLFWQTFHGVVVFNFVVIKVVITLKF